MLKYQKIQKYFINKNTDEFLFKNQIFAKILLQKLNDGKRILNYDESCVNCSNFTNFTWNKIGNRS